MKNLNSFVEDLLIAKSEIQEKQIGGSWEMSLPSIVIHGAGGGRFWGHGDWDDPWTPPYPENNSGSSNHVGGGGGGDDGSYNNGNNNVSNISDPEKLLAGLQSWLDVATSTMKDLINSGNNGSNYTEYLKALEATQATLDAMEKSNYKFRIQSFADNNNERQDAEVFYDNKTGEIVLNIELVPNNIGIISHELTHISQLLNGDLWIEDGNIKGYDINDEVEAYQRQHDITQGIYAGGYDLGGNKLEHDGYKVTPEDILSLYPGIYDNLPTYSVSLPDNDYSDEGQPYIGSGY